MGVWWWTGPSGMVRLPRMLGSSFDLMLKSVQAYLLACVSRGAFRTCDPAIFAGGTLAKLSRWG
jgi:hypothetical protein